MDDKYFRIVNANLYNIEKLTKGVLTEAVDDLDFERLDKFIQKNNRNKEITLLYTLKWGCEEAINKVLSYDFNFKQKNFEYAILDALNENFLTNLNKGKNLFHNTLVKLTDKGLDINARDSQLGFTIIFKTANYIETKKTKDLIELGANVLAKNTDNQHPMGMFDEDNLELAKLLYHKDLDFKSKGLYGENLVEHHLSSGNSKVVAFFCKKGAPISKEVFEEYRQQFKEVIKELGGDEALTKLKKGSYGYNTFKSILNSEFAKVLENNQGQVI